MKVTKPSWWTVQYIINNDGYKGNGAINGPKGIVIHSPGPGGLNTNQKMFNNFNRSGRGASIHGAIDPNGFMQMMPFTKKSGHVGSASKGSFNVTHLGFELCEPSGCKYNGNGSAIVTYNPPKGHFEGVKSKAVHLCAYLCQEYGINPLQKNANGGIVSHYEAHALGYGDNHADIRHWWEVWEKYTMDNFRQDVYNFMQKGEDDMTKDEVIAIVKEVLSGDGTKVSGWATEELAEAVKLGITDGTRPQGYATREESAIMALRSSKDK